ncbi:hypothetical protein Tco_0828137 [Tanacetum coccineum]
MMLSRGNTLRSGEDSQKLNELMEIYTSLQIRVFALEETKTTQDTKIVVQSRSNYRVDSFDEEESLGEEDASKQGRIADIDAHKDIYLVNVYINKDIFGVNDQDDADMFDVNTLDGDEVIVDNEVVVKIAKETVSAVTTTTTTTVITDDEITLDKALAELKSAKPSTQGITTAATTITSDSTRPKAKGIVMQEPSESTPTVSLQQPS